MPLAIRKKQIHKRQMENSSDLNLKSMMETINLFFTSIIKCKDKQWQRKLINQSFIKNKLLKYNKNKQKLIIIPLYFVPQHSKDNQKQKPIKVKTTNESRNKTQPEKLKHQTIETNRLQLTTQIPLLPRNGSNFEKPVIQYSPRKKGGLLPSQSQSKFVSKWNVPIAQSRDLNQKLFTNNESYLSVNQSIKSPFKQHQIQMRLDDIRNEGFLESMSLRIQKVFKYPLERNQLTYM